MPLLSMALAPGTILAGQTGSLGWLLPKRIQQATSYMHILVFSNSNGLNFFRSATKQAQAALHRHPWFLEVHATAVKMPTVLLLSGWLRWEASAQATTQSSEIGLPPRWKEQSSLCLMLDFSDQLVSLVEGLHSASTDFWKTQTCLCQELWSRLRSSAWHGPQSSTKFWDLAWLQWCTAWLNLVDVDLIQTFLRVALLVEEDAVVGVLPNVDTGKPFPLAIFPIWKSSAKLPHFLWRLSTKSRCRWGNRQHGSLQLKPASRGPPCLEDKSALIALELCPSKLLHGHDTFLPPVSRCMI